MPRGRKRTRSTVATPRSSRFSSGKRRQSHRGVGESEPAELRVDAIAQLGEGDIVDRRGEVEQSLVDATGVGDEHRHEPRGAERDDLDVTHARAAEGRVLGERDLLVNCDSSRTVRASTSSRSTASPRNVSIA